MRQTIANPGVRARLCPWPRDPSICHLVLLDVKMTPTTDDVERWVDEAHAFGTQRPGARAPTAIRTGALFPAAAQAFASSGFVEVDRLALLERNLTDRPQRRRPRPRRGSAVSTVRMSRRELAAAAEIDYEAFAPGWSNDAVSLDDIARATPQVRLRFAVRPESKKAPRERAAIGFSITGRAGTTGYLQRLAVRPDARRSGAARQLVEDALGWLTRRGATRVMVNTGVSNEAALALYARLGFRRMDDELVVLERRRVR